MAFNLVSCFDILTVNKSRMEFKNMEFEIL